MEELGESVETGKKENQEEGSLFEKGWIGSLSNQSLVESQNSPPNTAGQGMERDFLSFVTGEARDWLWWIQLEMKNESNSWNLFFTDSNQVQLFVSQARVLSPSTIVSINT